MPRSYIIHNQGLVDLPTDQGGRMKSLHPKGLEPPLILVAGEMCGMATLLGIPMMVPVLMWQWSWDPTILTLKALPHNQKNHLALFMRTFPKYYTAHLLPTLLEGGTIAIPLICGFAVGKWVTRETHSELSWRTFGITGFVSGFLLMKSYPLVGAIRGIGTFTAIGVIGGWVSEFITKGYFLDSDFKRYRVNSPRQMYRILREDLQNCDSEYEKWKVRQEEEKKRWALLDDVKVVPKKRRKYPYETYDMLLRDWISDMMEKYGKK